MGCSYITFQLSSTCLDRPGWLVGGNEFCVEQRLIGWTDFERNSNTTSSGKTKLRTYIQPIHKGHARPGDHKIVLKFVSWRLPLLTNTFSGIKPETRGERKSERFDPWWVESGSKVVKCAHFSRFLPFPGLHPIWPISKTLLAYASFKLHPPGAEKKAFPLQLVPPTSTGFFIINKNTGA